MRIDTLEEVYVDHLKELYHGKHQVLRLLSRMAGAAKMTDLRDALHDHSMETRAHVSRLDIIFDAIKTDPMGKQNKEMSRLLSEGDLVMSGHFLNVADHTALIAVAQRIERHELSSYRTNLAYARMLGERDAAELLNETMQEDGAFADLLAEEFARLDTMKMSAMQ